MVVLILYFAFVGWLSRSGMTRQNIPLDDGETLRPVTLTVTADGLCFDSEVSHIRLLWGALQTIDDRPDLVLIFVDRTWAYIVPRRAFPDVATDERFVAFLESKLPRSASQPG